MRGWISPGETFAELEVDGLDTVTTGPVFVWAVPLFGPNDVISPLSITIRRSAIFKIERRWETTKIATPFCFAATSEVNNKSSLF